MRLANRLLILSLALCSMRNAANAAYFILTDIKPKCVKFDSSRGSQIAINYESPDIQAPPANVDPRPDGRAGFPDPMSMMNNRGPGGRIPDNMNGGMDKRYHDRQRAMMERSVHGMMKSEPIITLTEFEGREMAETMSLREVLKVNRGTIKYTMEEYNSAQICIQNYGAHRPMPLLISIIVKDFYELPKPEKIEVNEEERRMVDNHMKKLERELNLLLQFTNRLLDGSSQSKLLHSSLKDTLVRMNQKFKWFSILQIIITLFAGTWYISSLLAFLRQRRIIY